MTTDDLVAAAAIAVVLIGVGVAVAVMRRAGQKRLATLAPAFELGTCRKVGPLGMAVKGLYCGYTCRYTIQHASQYSPGGAALRLAAAVPFRWSAHVVDAGSRLMVKLGLLQDLDVGAGELDDRLRFAADDEGDLRSLIGTGSVRTLLGTLLESPNFTAVQVRGGHFEARWAPRERRLDEDPEVLRARLDVVASLAVACGCPPSLAP
ncbi:MAG TPA: hypothetical protein VLT32_09825 [Candidatus Sulfomarinibacteraceae bacterium]|nr:hypothetical protein [Candidatus Sulfomarinibacteraceae bacterium]